MFENQSSPTAADWAALNELIELANKGDHEGLRGMREFLDENPQVWQHIGDLSRVAEHAWIDLANNGNSLVAESSTSFPRNRTPRTTIDSASQSSRYERAAEIGDCRGPDVARSPEPVPRRFATRSSSLQHSTKSD